MNGFSTSLSRFLLSFLADQAFSLRLFLQSYMAPNPPPFAKPTYWDERFTKNPAAFDWLLPANSLDGPIIDAISSSPNPRPRILHIGCGTSVLSLHLRAHVQEPHQVHNTDFSRVAIDLGAQWEREVFEANAEEERVGKAKAAKHDSLSPQPEAANSTEQAAEEQRGRDHAQGEVDCLPRMRWSTLDLLSLPSIRALAEVDNDEPHDIIVDKSTCDAIACGEDISVPLPYPLGLCSSPAASIPTPSSGAPLSSALIHPLHILALHLAYLVPSGGRWMALSYSDHRFPFLPPYPAVADEGRLDEDVVAAGFVHPGQLWRLERKEQIEAPDGEKEREEKEYGVVHKPKVVHWLYVMVRTDVGVSMERGA